MKGAAFRYGALLAMVCAIALPVMASEIEITDGDRVFRNFTREAATVGSGRIRLELRGFTMEDDGDTELNLLGFPVAEVERRLDAEVTRVRGGTINLLGSYGLGNRAEIGFDVPFFIQKTNLEGRSNINDEDIGDVMLYGKFKRMVATHCTMAAGLEISMPTGVERKSFGTGELGLNPFISSRYQRGRFALGAHLGYQMFSGSVDDVFNYSAEVLVRGNRYYVLRTEFSGRYFKAFGTDFHDAVVMPGVDVNLFDNFTIRPTGLGNMTDDAMDWGLGIGIAFTL